MANNPSTLVDYNGQVNAPNAAYPYGSARDDAVPGDLTGTPRVAAELRDIEGFQQSLLVTAGIVPTGAPDEVGASQYLEALKRVPSIAAAAVFDSVVSMVAGTTVAAAVSFAELAAAQATVQTQAYYSGWAAASETPKGGAFYVILTIADYGAIPDGFGDHYVGGGTDYVAAIVIHGALDVTTFGARNNGSGDSTTALQAALDYSFVKQKLAVYIPKGDVGNGAFLTSSVLTIYQGQHICGDSSRAGTIICLGNSAFETSAVGVGGLLIENLTLFSNVLHPVTPNTYVGIYLKGDTGNRPFYNEFRNVFIDGFKTAVSVEWTWATKILGCFMNRCALGILSNGLSVNNFVSYNTMGGDGAVSDDAGIKILGTAEGWCISNNLIDNFGHAAFLVGSSHNYIHNNIFDHCAKAGIAWSALSVNQVISGNYIGLVNSATTCINGFNTVDNVQQDGHSITDNELVTYGTATLGIALDLGDRGTRVSGNKMRTGFTTSLRTNNSPEDITVEDNNFRGQDGNIGGSGSTLQTKVKWSNNNAEIVNSAIVKRETIGTRDVVFENFAPTTGTFKVKDISYSEAPVSSGFIGYVCTTAGVAGSTAVFKSFGVVTP